MITLKPSHRPNNGRFDLLLTVVIEIPGKDKQSFNHCPNAAKALVTENQASTLLFDPAYQAGLWRAIRNATPGWRPGSFTPAAKAAPAVHPVKRVVRDPAPNNEIAELYRGQQRIPSSPMPSEPTGEIKTGPDGKPRLVVDPKANTVTLAEAAKPAVVQANEPDAQTTILEWWARRPAGQRRSSYLAQALNIKMDRLLDICREIGELAVTSHMNVLSVEQAGKIAQAVRQQGG
jgi:hypothetical protein